MDEEIIEALKDMDVDCDVAIERLMGDTEMYLKYIKAFPENKNIVDLEKAVEENDTEKAYTAVHTLKGVALNLSMLPLIDVTSSMVLDFKDGKKEEAMSQVQDVRDVFDEIANVIKKYL